jgi:prephenate dehydratase
MTYPGLTKLSLGCRLFNYIFYVDFEASMTDVRAQNALKGLEVSVVPSAYATVQE